ncbi:MAG TPA: YciI family protein [Candidatus Eisenbacteria bacterium]|nr:YciI family protein [Candidatus Eisenbacteria bacterium]
MRYLSVIRAAEQQGTPPAGFMEAIERYVTKSLHDGTVVSTGGLAPSAAAARIQSKNGKVTVVDGPFAESKEVIGGYAVIAADSRDAAIRATKEFMQLHADHWPAWQGECELRELVFLAP